MRRALGLLLLAALPAPAFAELAVEIVHPPPRPIFGEVEIRAEVRAEEPVERLVFHLDGRRVGELTAPPWRITVDAGQENREHRIVVTATNLSGATATAELTTPAIHVDERVELELNQIYVTVTGRKNRRVLDLDRRSFTLLDEGRRQQIVTFEGGDVPFTAVLLVDGSRSMQGTPLAAALAGVRSFVDGMRELDEARLLVTADRLLEVSPFVGDAASLTATLSTSRARGGTTLYDYLFLALQSLERRQGRRVVVLLSDGYDVQSVLSMEEVREAARRARSQLYWVRLTDESSRFEPDFPFSSWRSRRQAAAELDALEKAVAETGGRIVEIHRPAEAAEAFREILAELREQYVLGYYPEPRRNDGSFRRVKVEVSRSGLEVRTREGYVDH